MQVGDDRGLATTAKITIALLFVVAAGVAAGFVAGVGPFGSADTAPIDQVPAGTDVVYHVDMEIRDDPATKTLVNESLSSQAESQYYAGPESYSELMNQTRGNTSLDPSKLEEALSFGKYPPEGASSDQPAYWAVIMHAGWSSEDVVSEMENKSTTRTWTESSYNGHTVYESEPEAEYRDPAWFAILGDGQYVVGRPAAVKDAIDVAEGDEEAVGGELRSEYDSLSDDALMSFVADVPRDRIPEESVEQASRQAPVDYNVFTEIDMVSGTYYTTSDSLGVTVHMSANDADTAKDVFDVTDGGISFASGSVSNETVKEGLRDVEVSRDEETVTVTYEKSVGHVKQLLAALEELGL